MEKNISLVVRGRGKYPSEVLALSSGIEANVASGSVSSGSIIRVGSLGGTGTGDSASSMTGLITSSKFDPF